MLHIRPTTHHTYITIVLYKNAQSSVVYGLKDLFTVAQMAYADEHSPPHHTLSVQICDDDTLPFLNPSSRHIVIIPPSLKGIPESHHHTTLLQHLHEWHRNGITITSVCAGAFLLAEATLLDTLSATTHWAYSEVFKKRYPQIRTNVDKLLIDHGHVITAGGLMAWVDLGLHLVGRIYGNATMIKTAHFMVVQPPRQQQSPYSDVQLRYTHSDHAILTTQRWLEQADISSVTVNTLTHVSRLTPRTFLRRFKQATGLTPKAYLLHYRMAYARQEFETTSKSVAQVAWEAGYHETSAFSRAFKKITGLSPARYRRRS